MRVYLVGGAVRDLLLGRRVADRDFLVLDAAPEEFLARHPSARSVGKFFPVYLLDGREYAWPRGADLDADLGARDLTINALALGACPRTAGLFHGHPLALADLQNRILRPASDAAMAADPVRVFRAARFAAVFPDFSPHPSLIEQMRAAAASGALAGIAPERVMAETRKALAAPRPGRFLTLLDRSGCLSPWFAELEGAAAIPAGPAAYHDKSVLGHIAEVMDRLAASEEKEGNVEESDGKDAGTARELLVWMGLCHDLGKTATPPEKWPSHHGHDALGEPLAERLAERLGAPNSFRTAGVLAARLHMKAGRYPELRPGSRVDLLESLGKRNLVAPLFQLVAADHGHDYLEQASRDLAAMLAVHLPEEERDHGAASGEKLRLLRCQALASLQGPAGDGCEA